MSEKDWGNKLQQAQEHVSSRSFPSQSGTMQTAAPSRSEAPTARMVKQLVGSGPSFPSGSSAPRSGLPTTNTKSQGAVDPQVMYLMNQAMVAEILNRLKRRIRG